jgi:hypothetical protein
MDLPALLGPGFGRTALVLPLRNLFLFVVVGRRPAVRIWVNDLVREWVKPPSFVTSRWSGVVLAGRHATRLDRTSNPQIAEKCLLAVRQPVTAIFILMTGSVRSNFLPSQL